MTNKSVLPLPTPPFDFSTEECEDASDKRTEVAKLAEEFATKNLTLQERMEAILKMISGKSGEEEAEEEEENPIIHRPTPSRHAAAVVADGFLAIGEMTGKACKRMRKRMRALLSTEEYANPLINDHSCVFASRPC
ncbi:hypothetical protein niasHT_027271 [Heterodera trifolii]|uniref:Uncharacterized protein n=1 Tax=Heterodera trifolii TaxID=157864 RepID=A0ABD2JTQ2_9BILA